MELSQTFKEEFNLKLNQLRRFTSHGPSIGRYIELTLINLFRKYFPETYDFGTGFVYSLDPTLEAKCSQQIDIICYDKKNYPIFFNESEIVVVSPMSVKGIIEVKSTLDKKSIEQVLDIARSDSLKGVSLNSKIYLVAAKSSVKVETVFKNLKDYFESQQGTGKSKENKLLGAIFCLDWKHMLSFDTVEKDQTIRYSCSLIDINDYGISAFALQLIFDLYGKEQYMSIANVLSPSIYHLDDSFSISYILK